MWPSQLPHKTLLKPGCFYVHIMKITLYIYFLTDCSSFFHVHFFLCLKRHISFSLLLWLIYKQCRWCYSFATFVLCSLVIGSHCLGRVSFSNSCLVCVLVTSCIFFFHFGKNPKGHPPPPPPSLFFHYFTQRGPSNKCENEFPLLRI